MDDENEAGSAAPAIAQQLDALIAQRDAALDPRARKLLDMWPKTKAAYSGDEHIIRIRDREIRTALTVTTLSGSEVRKVALPKFVDHGEILRWLMLDNLPGYFPFTAGVFPFRRENGNAARSSHKLASRKAGRRIYARPFAKLIDTKRTDAIRTRCGPDRRARDGARLCR